MANESWGETLEKQKHEDQDTNKYENKWFHVSRNYLTENSS